MAGTSAATLTVSIVVDAAKAAAGMDAAAGKFGKLGQTAGKLAGPAAAVVGGIGAIAVASVDAASDVQQSFGGLDAVFGNNADQMKKWADTAAETTGLSKSQYATMAAGIGAQLKNLGVPMDQIAGQTDEMVRLGADLAATYGGTTEEAVSALGAALRGEADPAERFGLALNQTAIKAQMAADGTDKLTGEAAKQAKAQALLKLATEQAGGAIGQFAKESDSAAGAQEIATAQMEDAKAAIGEALLPAVSALAGMLGTLASIVKEHPALFQALAAVLGVLAVAILAAAAAQWAMNSAMLASPVTWIILAIVALIAVLVLMWTKMSGLRKLVEDAWNGIKAAIAAVGPVLNSIGQWFVRLGAQAVQIASKVKAVFVTAWNTIKSTAATVWNGIIGIVRKVLTPIMAVANAIKNTLIGAFNNLKRVAGDVLNAILKPINLVKKGFDTIVGAVRDLVGWIRNIKIPSLPSWVTNMQTPWSVTTAAPVRVAGRSGATRSSSGAGVVINVNGALDPEAVARQIQGLLNGASVRRRGVVLAART